MSSNHETFNMRVWLFLAWLLAGGISLVQSAEVRGRVSTSVDLIGKSAILSNRERVLTATIASDGSFLFGAVALGQYALELSNTAYSLTRPVTVTIASAVDTVDLGSVGVERFAIDGSSYSYRWSQDQTYSGSEATAGIVQPTVVTIAGNAYTLSDANYAQILKSNYNIVLMDSMKAWDAETAYRLFSNIERIPYCWVSPYEYTKAAKPSIWKLTDNFLDNDIKIEEATDLTTVTVSTAAFVYAAPFVAQIEDKRGLYFSKRLHHALLRFVTKGGEDRVLIDTILTKRFGVTTTIPDYAALTGELAGRFQQFHSNELLQIINSFEELPEGFHVIPALKYLVRRLDGTVNPYYPEAAAIASGNGYIEFMEKAFARVNELEVQRLVLHEKAHFIYWSTLSPATKEAWNNLGGWYRDANGVWTTEKTTEFVSAYSHSKNPDEDFAETVAYFVNDPDKLKGRSMPKYEFMRDAVMFGNSYVAQIRQDLTFQVYNLFPNYNYPGKVKRVQVTVTGAPSEDKIITCEMEIQPVGPKDNPVRSIGMRVYGPTTREIPRSSYFDFGLSPIDSTGLILRGSYTLSKYARRGYWAPDQISITDVVNNERYERAVLYGWRCYIDNPLEDLEPPAYVANSVRLGVRLGLIESRPVQILSVDWDVREDRGLSAYNSALTPPSINQYSTYSGGAAFAGDGTAHTEFIITEFAASGVYKVPMITMQDFGLNVTRVYFTNGGGWAGAVDGTEVGLDEAPAIINITTANPDYSPPELDLNRISVIASPTVPDAPNGETQVTLKYLARDDKSGLGIAGMKLRDPQGIEHGYYLYHENFHSLFFTGDPTAWKQYSYTVLLPVGSVPGTWGVASIDLVDKAQNAKSYSFVEIVRFDPYSTAAADLGITGDPVGGVFARGTSFELRVIVVGGNRVNYKWLRNGVALSDSPGSASEIGPVRAAASRISGAESAVLVVSGAAPEDSGNYAVIVSNAAGAVTSKFAAVSVTDDVSPTIVAGPVSLNRLVGQAAAFSVTVAGSPAPALQWYKDGVEMSGVTGGTLSLASVTTDDAGGYSVKASNAVGSIWSNTAVLTVNRASQTISFGTLDAKIYGAVPFTLGATASSGLEVTYTLTGGPATVSGSTVTITGAGTVTIRAAQAGNAYYSAAPAVEQSFTVTKAPLTVSADNKSRSYGAENPVPTVTYSGFVNGETAVVLTAGPSLGTAAVVASNVGTYPITPTGGTAANYAFVYVSGTLTVTKVPVVAKANDSAKTVGAGNPELTISYTGFVLGEGPGALDVLPSISTTATASSPVGDYPITLSGGSDANYAFTLQNGTLVVRADLQATHGIVGGGYIAGGTVTITNTISYLGAANALTWQALLPNGWSFLSDAGSAGNTRPRIGATSLLEWTWIAPPAGPVAFSYTVNVPPSAAGEVSLASLIVVSLPGSIQSQQILARPDPLLIPQVSNHTADRDGNMKISLLELTRVIELFNTRNGTTRTGCYKVDATGEDGFNPEPTRGSTTVVTLTAYHNADSSRDGKISLLELTRVIELFNYRSGTTRTGQYHAQSGTEDGFNPGP